MYSPVLDTLQKHFFLSSFVHFTIKKWCIQQQEIITKLHVEANFPQDHYTSESCRKRLSPPGARLSEFPTRSIAYRCQQKARRQALTVHCSGGCPCRRAAWRTAPSHPSLAGPGRRQRSAGGTAGQSHLVGTALRPPKSVTGCRVQFLRALRT